MSDESSGRKRALKPPEDPVFEHNDKWWFRDADDWRVGPYDTEAAARRRLEQYLEKSV